MVKLIFHFHKIKSVNQLICKLQDLAIANNNLYDMLSFPLTIFIFLHMETVIIIFNLIIYLYRDLGLASLLFGIIPTLSWLYIAFLTQMNHQIKALFDQISGNLSDHHQEGAMNRMKEIQTLQSRQIMMLKKGGTTTVVQKGALYPYASVQQQNQGVKSSKKTCQVRLHEIELYRAYFEIRLYYLARVDMTFMLHAGLFALNYFVFLQQTQ